MARVVKFLRLSAQQRWLLCKVTMLLSAIRLALWIVPYPAVRAFLDRLSHGSAKLERDPSPAEQLAWATTVAGRFVPGGGHCLSQALTLRTVMTRRGYTARICYGVREVDGAPFMAHAWVEHDGAVLIGGGNLDRFRQLMAPSEVAPEGPDRYGGRPDVESA
jgi:hypothetical protein